MPRLLRARAALGQRRAARVLRTGLDALLAATLAPACAACRQPLDSPSASCVCPICWATTITAPRPPWTTAHIAEGRSAGAYEGALRDVIHAFKYEGRRSLAAPLGRILREAGRPLLEECDCVVPVPLHPWRRLSRGFNQARDLAERLDRPVVDALWRVRATATQMSLNAEKRQTNVRDAFIASPRPACRTRIRGARIVLVDDVRTTGATLDACAHVLVEAGAARICALTVAVAEVSARRGPR